MMPERYFIAQACNNAWANHRLLKACAMLGQAELVAKRESFFPSIIHTLNHILTVDWLYIGALEGDCPGSAAFDPEIPYPRFEDLDREQRLADRRLVNHCLGMTSETLGREIRIPRRTHVQLERTDRILLHLFQHQIHHRGQVHAMLSGTSVKPPQLDEFFPGDPAEQALRAKELAELGLTESIIWSE